jgi:DNA helicase-2/ATP-dependent DNA helicase PcrA
VNHLLDQLNEQQRDAVLATEGPVLVIAGAGSGKTRVLTCRTAWLIRSCGVSPDQIVAVTFTNKAASEMKERIADLLDGEPRGIRMGTFHSLCLRILRVEAERLGYLGRFAVYDTSDQTAVMKEVVSDLNLDPNQHPPKALLSRISAARNRLVSEPEIASALKEAGGETLWRVHEAYAEKLRSANAMDFDDLILNALYLFERHPEVERRYQEQIRHVLVDEFQDTNKPQYALVSRLAAGTRNLCVVGDDAQSIYRFRGAEVGNILRFTEDYPGARTIQLTRNYRSSARILEAAGDVIRHNRVRIDKELWTDSGEGHLITYLQAATDKDEALFVADQIRGLRREPADGVDLSDIAVLYRTNAQSRLIEEALMNAGLAYRIYGGLRFYDRKEIKDLLAYLRLAANPADDVSLRRVLNVPPRGLGKAASDAIEEAARAEGVTLYVSVERAAAHEHQGRSTRALRSLVELMSDLRARAEASEPTSSLITELVDRLKYAEHLRRSEAGDAESRIENVGQLIAAAKERESYGEFDLQAFLDGAALVSDVESVTGGPGVNLMTLHCSKGLEFPAVFMVGMEERLFPHVRSVEAENHREEIEEERRLCYVGMTRAKKRLFLSCARQRRSFGTMVFNEPSRFISEVGPGLLDDLTPHWEQARQASSWRTSYSSDSYGARPRRAPPASSRETALGDEDISVHPEEEAGEIGHRAASLKIGMKVFHSVFGYGEVERLEGDGEKQKATVKFSGWGRKKLMTHYANLQRAGS